MLNVKEEIKFVEISVIHQLKRLLITILSYLQLPTSVKFIPLLLVRLQMCSFLLLFLLLPTLNSKKNYNNIHYNKKKFVVTFICLITEYITFYIFV